MPHRNTSLPMHILRSFVLLLSLGTLVSCQSIRSKKSNTPGPVPSALQSGHWHQVRKNPPTYFPKGIPADHPTEFRDGSWVYSGDQRDSRFFIPAHGTRIPQLTLIAEAQQTMSPEARRELQRQGRRFHPGTIATKTADGIGKVVGGAAQAVAKVGDVIPGLPSRNKKTPTPDSTGPAPGAAAPAQE